MVEQNIKINHCKKQGLEYFVVDNFFTLEELLQVKQEILDLKKYEKQPNDIYSAKEKNIVAKTGSGFFIEQIFNDVKKSIIEQAIHKLFYPPIAKKFEEYNCLYANLSAVYNHSVLVGYYKNGDKYNAHIDANAVTAVFMFKFGEIEGGNLVFTDYETNVECQDNRLIVFSGTTKHEVKEVISQNEDMRVSITCFINSFVVNKK